VLFLYLIMVALAERWWPASLLLFMPRWVMLLPLVALAIANRWLRRTSVWVVQAFTALLILGPFMGFNVPFGRMIPYRPTGSAVRIMTFNRCGAKIDVDRLRQLVERERIDVVCLQDSPPDRALDGVFAAGWHWNASRSIASRFPIVAEFPVNIDPSRGYGFSAAALDRVRIRLANGREFLLTSIHMPRLRAGVELLTAGDVHAMKQHIEWRWSQTEALAGMLRDLHEVPIIAAGDFCMPSSSPMMSLLKQDFTIGFDQAGWGYGYTRPSALPWIDLDHILATSEWTFTSCHVGPPLGSRHLPVIAEVVLRHPQNSDASRSGSLPNRRPKSSD
jgi:endonuclease/exonuclease/phosphatase family metal-dependent hydrolase